MRADLEAIVLCGGRGTRLGALSAQTPKPLLPVEGEPFLRYLLGWMKEQGVRRIILAAHYLAEQFERFIDAYAKELPPMELIIEPQPLGTGGALRYAVTWARASTLVVVNGDSWLPQSLAPVLQKHAQARWQLTAVVVPASHVEGGALNKGTWTIGPNGTNAGFSTQTCVTQGWVNAGLYVLEHAFALSWPQGFYSLEARLPELLEGHAAGVFCSEERLLDIGTPDCYAQAAQRLRLRSQEKERKEIAWVR